MSWSKSNLAKYQWLNWQLGLDYKHIHVPLIMETESYWSFNKWVIGNRVVYVTSIGQREYPLKTIHNILFIPKIIKYVILFSLFFLHGEICP